MLKPFYQGKLDVFCALYAVLNGLRITHNVRTLKAMEHFNDALMNFSLKPMAWHKILNQRTDYIEEVDEMLENLKKKYPLEVVGPYVSSPAPHIQALWALLEEWLQGEDKHNRAIIFRFVKYPAMGKALPLRHWTTAHQIDDQVMRLFDSSHDAEAILNINKSVLRLYDPEFDTDMERDPIIYIHPKSIRLLRLPF